MRSAALLLIVASASACASARTPTPPTRDVWVPRAESHGLAVDEGSSRIREIHLPSGDEALKRLRRGDVGPAPASSS